MVAPLAASLWIAHGAAQTQPPGDQSPFRGGVELVSLNVTALEGARYVTDLDVADFQVFEDGILQDVSFFNKANMPIALSLLMDTSASMESRMQTAQQAAIGFARRLRAQDLAEVLDFDSRVTTLQAFTNDPDLLEQAIRKTAPGGSTMMYNALYIALKSLQRVAPASTDEIRRQAVVLLSDGEDTSSLLPFEEVLDLAKRSDTTIYTIGLRATEDSSRRGFNEAQFVLRQFAQETGGRSFFPMSVSDLPAIYGQISDELSSQYSLGYIPKNARRDGTYRRIVVRINRPKVAARTKLGYFAPAP
jgi:Ca-activated chloride channel family protein